MNLLLIRGLGRHSENWGIFPKLLEENGIKVMTIDYPGIGEFVDQKSPMSIGELTNDLRMKFLKNVSQSEKWSILAISLGGMVALDWVARFPKDFAHIITINSSSKSLSPIFHRMRPKALKALTPLLFTSDLYKRERSVLELTTNQIKITEKLINENVRVANKMQLSKVVFFKQLIAAMKFKIPERIVTPYTVIVSEKDKFTNASCSKKIANKYNATLASHPEAGHDLPADDPYWLINILKNI